MLMKLPIIVAIAAYATSVVHAGPLQRSPPNPFPSDGDDLDTVVCLNDASYACL